MTCQTSRAAARNSAAASPATPSSMTFCPADRAGLACACKTLDHAFAPLGLHDSFEVRVPGLADLLGDRHNRRQLRGQVGRALFGDPLCGQRAAGDGQRPDERELRQIKPLGEHRRDRRCAPVTGLVAGDDQIKADATGGGGQGRRGLHGVGSGERVVQHVHRLVSAHCQRLPQRFSGLLGPHRENCHLSAVGLHELQGGFHAAGVDLVDDIIGGIAVEGPIGGPQSSFRVSVGHMLDQDHDVHWFSSRLSTMLWYMIIINYSSDQP
jgi:hypothetical protein